MAEFQYSDLPEILSCSEAIEVLAAMEHEHRLMYDRAVKRAKDQLHPIDHVVATALRRSIAFTNGFLSLVDQDNEFAAMPFIRMQLDNVLRVSAFRLVVDPFALATHMIEGKNLPTFNKRKIDLNDSGLRKKLAHKYDYINELYEETSGYVHLSQHHMIRVIEDWENQDRKEEDEIRFGDIEELPTWSEHHKREALVFFCTATRFLLDEANKVQSAERSE